MQFPVTQPALSAGPRRIPGMLAATVALFGLAACEVPLDADLRSLGAGFSTTEAALNAAERPRPDANGIISYPNYQVVVAQQGDTVRAIATRLGLNAEEVARYNGIAPDAGLRRDEIVALPSRVPAAGGAATGTIAAGTIDVTSVAGAAIDRAGPVTTAPLAPATAATAPPTTAAPAQQPVRHQVVRGETAFSIARLYDVLARTLGEWNGLGPDLAIREGQYLLIPVAGAAPPARAPEPVTPPGSGSPTPVPPSATAPLPDESPEPPASVAATEPPASTAPDLGATQTAPARASQFIYPVQGAIIRAYAPGRNEGIDIGAAAGTEVRAAGAGTVAAITRNTEGIQIVVIRHANDLLTVYTHLEDLAVQRDQTVSQGQTIGKVRPGDPSFLHFEVRRGMESADPLEFLP
jgi:lipoprotein NlpD